MPVGRPRSDRQLVHCREEGMICRECVRERAASLVQITNDLNGPQVRLFFAAMYPETACLAMASVFMQFVSEERNLKLRKPVFSEPLYQVAVA
jgi:hypothetical protein